MTGRRILFTFMVGIATASLLTSCATALEKSTQKIKIVTPGVDGAFCAVEDKTMHYNMITPGDVAVQKGDGDIFITCKSAGYYDGTARLTSKVSDAVSWNIVNGLLPGALYDYETGALYEYPDEVTVYLTPIDDTAEDTVLPRAVVYGGRDRLIPVSQVREEEAYKKAEKMREKLKITHSEPETATDGKEAVTDETNGDDVTLPDGKKPVELFPF